MILAEIAYLLVKTPSHLFEYMAQKPTIEELYEELRRRGALNESPEVYLISYDEDFYVVPRLCCVFDGNKVVDLVRLWNIGKIKKVKR